MINTKKDLRDMLVKRDHITSKEASYMINNTQQIIDDCITNCTYEDLEEILADNLGLEMDYIHIFIM